MTWTVCRIFVLGMVMTIEAVHHEGYGFEKVTKNKEEDRNADLAAGAEHLWWEGGFVDVRGMNALKCFDQPSA